METWIRARTPNGCNVYMKYLGKNHYSDWALQEYFSQSDAEASISEEPGARKPHAGICAGAIG
jgi:hypothetical protein